MRGQSRLIWGAVRAGVLAFPPAALAALFIRGPEGVAAVAAAFVLVVGNLVVSGLVLNFAAKRSPDTFFGVALPSYALRMMAIFGAMGFILSQPGIDHTTFSIAFAAGLTWVLFYECRLWARTPWLALEFGKENP